MIPKKVRDILKKQHYGLVGKHSAVQICRWTKRSIRGEGVCYKEKFYGIKSHQCCQMTPAVVWCPNKCLHCWRAVELTLGDKLQGKIDSPKEIIEECIKVQKKLLEGFKILPETRKITKSRADMKKWEEAQEPMQFAISLSGEPTVYPKIGELIKELTKRGKTTFLVTNGLYPEVLKKLEKENKLPTQLYISVNSTNKESYEKFHRSSKTDAWKKFNNSLEIFPLLRKKTRTIFRINLIKDLNIKEIGGYSRLIKKADPLFIEVKGFMSVGFARQRLGYEKMPRYEEMKEFCKKLVENLGGDFVILDSHERSRAFVIGRKKERRRLKIK